MKFRADPPRWRYGSDSGGLARGTPWDTRTASICGISAVRALRPKALAKQAMERGVDVFAGYGMSDTGPLLTVAHLKSIHLSGDPDREVDLRTRAGRACPLVDLRIVDADMKETPHDRATSGEIVVRAPWLSNGYFNSPDASEQLPDAFEAPFP